MITQLNPPIPVITTSKGSGLAWAIIDYSPEHHLIWVVAIDSTGEIWALPNPEVRAQKNITMGRMATMNKVSTDYLDSIDKLFEKVEEIKNSLELTDEYVDKNHSLIQHAEEGIEKLFERIELLDKRLEKLENKIGE